MRVFISADIEGVTTTTRWPQTEIGQPGYAEACAQMTAEVAAACEGAIAAGADYILVKDAHDSACNLDPNGLPACAELERGWCGHPYSMATGVDGSFDAALFVGYHSAAGRDGSPLSHTFSRKTVWVRLNGVKCSEFRLYSWACALEGVPTVFLSGDKMLCDDSAGIHPLMRTVAVKDGFGGMTRSIQPQLACERIRESVREALSQELPKAKCILPEHFTFDVCYKTHPDAVKMSFYPGFNRLDDNTNRMETDSFLDVLRAVCFVL